MKFSIFWNERVGVNELIVACDSFKRPLTIVNWWV